MSSFITAEPTGQKPKKVLQLEDRAGKVVATDHPRPVRHDTAMFVEGTQRMYDAIEIGGVHIGPDELARMAKSLRSEADSPHTRIVDSALHALDEQAVNPPVVATR